jgi:hypothetical protein
MQKSADTPDGAAALQALVDSAAQLHGLMQILQEYCAVMFVRVGALSRKDRLRSVLLSKLIEVRLVLRGMWKSAHMLAPCACKLENVAAAANSVGVCLYMLEKNSLARVWFSVALRDAAVGGSVHSIVCRNIALADEDERNLSGAATPENDIEEEDLQQTFTTEDANLLLQTESAMMTLKNTIMQHNKHLQVLQGFSAPEASDARGR